MTKRREGVAFEIITSFLYKKKKIAEKECKEEKITKKEEKAAKRKARA